MSLSTEHLARTCARRPWLTLGAWLVALVLAIATIAALLDLTTEGEITSNPESEQGYEAMSRHLARDENEEYVNELVLVRSTSFSVDDARFREKVEAVLADVLASGVAHNARSYFSSGDAELVSREPERNGHPGGHPG